MVGYLISMTSLERVLTIPVTGRVEEVRVAIHEAYTISADIVKRCANMLGVVINKKIEVCEESIEIFFNNSQIRLEGFSIFYRASSQRG